MKNIRLTVWIGMMCGCLAAGMLQAGTTGQCLSGRRRRQPLVVAGDAPGGRCGSGSYI